MKKYITIIGNVGSGKSTLSRFLAKNLQAQLIVADEFYKTNPFFKQAVLDRTRWSLASDLWFLMKRAELTRQMSQKLAKKDVIQDSGLLMTWVYANSRRRAGSMTREESDLYDLIFAELTSNILHEDLVIYLNLPIDMLLANIRRRGREFEVKHHNRKYLEGIQESLSELVRSLRKKRTLVLEFNERNWCDIVHSKQAMVNCIQMVKENLET